MEGNYDLLATSQMSPEDMACFVQNRYPEPREPDERQDEHDSGNSRYGS